jgi:hypothetical protein
MAISQGSTPGTSYTWTTATWDWNDIRATSKTWATAYATAFTCTETDSAPLFAEARLSSIGGNDAESFATAEVRTDVWAAVVKVFETFATAENRRSTFAEAIAEAFATAEARTDVWAASRAFSSSWATAEARRSIIGSNDSEAFATAEAITSFRTFLRNLSETVGFLEVKNTSLTSVNPEAFAWASAQSDVWTAIKTNPETFTVAETYSDIIAWIQANLESWTTSTAKNTELGSVNPEAFSTTDSRSFSGVNSESEAFSVADARKFDGAFNENDGFAIASAQTDVAAFSRAFSSAWSTAEQRFSAPTKVGVSLFATADAVTDVIGFARNFAEAFATAEVKNTALNSINPESWATAESRRSSVTNVEPEAFATIDARRFDMTDPKAETLGMASAQTDVWSVSRGFASSWNTSEARVSAIGNNEARPLSFAEVRSGVAIFSRNWAEALPILAAEPTTVFKAFASSFAISEARADVWSAFRNHAETLAWTESYIDNINWIQANNETLAMASSDRFVMVKQLADAFSTASARSFSATKRANNEVMSMVETYADFINFIQANSESFGLSDTRRSTIAANIRRSLAMRDMALRNASGVYGDITVRNYAMTADTFAEFVAGRAPIGYAPFKEFLAGDYSFETALINAAVVPTSGSNSTMSIQSLTTNVDVPDINDRGSAALTTAGSTITFARTFTIAPQVVAQQTAGAVTAIPRVSSINTTTFFIQLFDAANPNVAVAGSVSWAATGY